MSERLAILGGTFDPIHFGHLAIAEEVCWRLDAARMFFVPAAQQPFKLNMQVAGAADRLQMVRLATAGNPSFEVCDLEVRRGGRSYSIDTLTSLREDYPSADFVFVAGADVLADLPGWHSIDRLLELTRFAILTRPGYELDLDPTYKRLPAARGRVFEVVGPKLDISSSDLRSRLATGAPVRYQLPDVVLDYIEDHGLYTTRA